MTEPTRFFAPRAWIDGQWASDVLMEVNNGSWCGLQANLGPQAKRDALVLDGAVVPGLVNAHSHAFQRAIAGLTERGGGHDDFWSWRDRMYSAALRITPEQLEAIATQLYTELLAGGYTQVCEFHYLHNDANGNAYADPLELSLALVRAAQTTGIGLTLLPTLYMRSGFGASGLREDQRRFAGTPERVLAVAHAVNALDLPGIQAGVALHSLRAVDPGALREVAQASVRQGWPVHIHIAEQMQEVRDCIAHHGQRPIEWLLNQTPMNAHWNLVHATHTTADELQGLREVGAAIVICPSTEANLGDGVFDLPGWLGRGGAWSIGSDSHMTRHWLEELRLLEYSQRLSLQQRNVAARVAAQDSTAAVLLQGALAGGSAASGQSLGGLAVGQRADFLVLDDQADTLAGVPPTHWLDAAVFSSPAPAWREVFVAGRAVPTRRPQVRQGFMQAMAQLWG